MKKSFKIALVLMFLTPLTFVFASKAWFPWPFSIPDQEVEEEEGNDYPIVLIHGLGGWGPGEMLGLNVWGAFHSIPDMLRSEGFTVYEVKVGPFSSVWDRAVDGFYRLKGGRIDYGKAHSEKYGHLQFTRTLKGLYPEWGELNEDGTRKKVHLLGHSLGGQTVRTLAQLLNDVQTDQGDSQLFTEDLGDWVASVSTISACHDGTSIVALGKKFGIDKIAGALAMFFASFMPKNCIYDPMMEQFRLIPQKGEGLTKFFKRAATAMTQYIWAKDFSIHDLSPDGAAELNGWVKAQPDTYYFSYSTTASAKLPLVPFHRPRVWMSPSHYQMSLLIGFTAFIDDFKYDLDCKWFENDGIVNTISMNGPKLNSDDKIVKFNKKSINPGEWNDMGKVQMDHTQVVGLLSCWKKVKSLFLNHAEILATLPKGDPVEVAVDGIDDNIEAPYYPPSWINPYTDDSTYEGLTEAPPQEMFDADLDGIIDIYEEIYGLDPNDASDADLDTDDDGLSNLQEYFTGTSARSTDSDDDEIDDSWEVLVGLEPRYKGDGAEDGDNDGLINSIEFIEKTDPFKSDTDGDGYKDGEEVAAGSDPTSASSWPVYGLPTSSVALRNFAQAWILIAGIIVVGIATVALYWNSKDKQGSIWVMNLKIKLRIFVKSISDGFHNMGSRMSVWTTSQGDKSRSGISEETLKYLKNKVEKEDN